MEHATLQRIVIYTGDVVRITGKSERQARRLIELVRIVHGKRRNGLVTIKEFCDYHCMDLEHVLSELEQKRLPHMAIRGSHPPHPQK